MEDENVKVNELGDIVMQLDELARHAKVCGRVEDELRTVCIGIADKIQKAIVEANCLNVSLPMNYSVMRRNEYREPVDRMYLYNRAMFAINAPEGHEDSPNRAACMKFIKDIEAGLLTEIINFIYARIVETRIYIEKVDYEIKVDFDGENN